MFWIIDDDPIFRLIHKYLLSEQGVASEAFDTIANAKNELLTINKPDLLPEVVLLDINMGAGSLGWEFIEAFKSLPLFQEFVNSTAIYMVSSSTASEDIAKAKSYTEVLGFIVKPLNEYYITEVKGKASIWP